MATQPMYISDEAGFQSAPPPTCVSYLLQDTQRNIWTSLSVCRCQLSDLQPTSYILSLASSKFLCETLGKLGMGSDKLFKGRAVSTGLITASGIPVPGEERYTDLPRVWFWLRLLVEGTESPQRMDPRATGDWERSCQIPAG